MYSHSHSSSSSSTDREFFIIPLLGLAFDFMRVRIFLVETHRKYLRISFFFFSLWVFGVRFQFDSYRSSWNEQRSGCYDNNDLWCVGTRYVITVYPKEWRWRWNQGTYVWEWCWIYIETCSNKARSSYLTYGKYMCRRQVKPRTMKKILDEEYKCECMKLTAAQVFHTRCKWAWTHQPKRQSKAKFSASDNHLQIPQAQTSFRNP